MRPILIPKQKPIDEQWFTLLQPLATLPGEIYNYLPPSPEDKQAAKELFYASNMQANIAQKPNEEYGAPLAQNASELKKLKAKIQKQEASDLVKIIYTQRIDELLTNCDMWMAASEGDTEKFAACNQQLYQAPNREIFAAGCAWVREQALRHITHTSIGVQQAAEAVLRHVPDENGDAKRIIPDEQTYQKLYNLHFSPGGYMDQLFEDTYIPKDGLISQREGDATIKQVLKNIGVAYTVADSPDIYWRIQHFTRHVVRPAEYHMTPPAFRAIISHEVGSHLLERANGLRGPLRLLSIGMAHYEHGNEGRANMREQLVLGSVSAAMQDEGWQLCLAKHIGISLAIGHHGQKYTFSQIYEVMSAVHTFWYRLEQPNRQMEADAQAREHAWSITCRLLAGTNGQGGAYLKDIVYLEGNVGCWQEAKRNPTHILRGDIGKFNLCNAEQVQQLRELGILR
jgi:hypothetical protein